jgi:hypothetical protein
MPTVMNKRRGGRAVSHLLEVHQLLARVHRHRHGVLAVRGQHVDQVEDTQRIEVRKITATITAGQIRGKVTLKNTLTG